jgi:hypothetical protein
LGAGGVERHAGATWYMLAGGRELMQGTDAGN